jgi:hypothetical protein
MVKDMHGGKLQYTSLVLNLYGCFFSSITLNKQQQLHG